MRQKALQKPKPSFLGIQIFLSHESNKFRLASHLEVSVYVRDVMRGDGTDRQAQNPRRRDRRKTGSAPGFRGGEESG